MKVEYAFYSDPGGRAVNEDTVGFIPVQDGFCALVADGLGGLGNGDIASKNAVSTVAGLFRERPFSDPENIRVIFNAANDEAIGVNHGKRNTMSTLVGLFFAKDGVSYAHVGDSRFYHFYQGRIAERTLDHSVPQISVSLGEITEDQIRSHPDRNRVLRAMGADAELKTEIHKMVLQPGFHAFLLCTDGFWEYVYEDEMEIELARSTTSAIWLESMKKYRIGRAPADADNNSAITIFYEERG